MAGDRQPSTEELKQRLAAAGSDAERLAALLEFRNRIGELPRDEVMGYLQEAVELARKTGNHECLARAGIGLSELRRSLGDISGSLESAEYVQQAAAASGSGKHEGQYLYIVGCALQERGDYGQARECYERCLAVWQRAGFTTGVTSALSQLGGLLALQGHASEALEYYQKCLEIDEELGDASYLSVHQYNIGEALARLGRWEDAVESYYRAIALSERHAMLELRASALNALGELFLVRDKVAKAIRMFQLVIEAAARGEVLLDTLHESTGNLGLAYRRQGDFASAEQTYERAISEAEQAGDRRVVAIVLWRMAELALDRGQFDRCRELADRAATVAREVGLRCEEAQALRVTALLHAARSEKDQARDCFKKALALLHDLEDSHDLACVRLHCGRFLLMLGEHDAAVTHLKAASRVFRKLGTVAEAHEVNRLLFRQEMNVDGDMALLQGLSGLASLGVEPQVLLEQAAGLLLEAFRFDRAVIFAHGRPVVAVGNMVLDPVLVLGNSHQVVATESTLSWPVRSGGGLMGRIYLERTKPLTNEHNNLVLDTIANLLAAPIRRLAELSANVAEERTGPAGLRYRGVVGPNPRMAELLATVCTVARKDGPVLIRGERGTGKRLVARALHDSGASVGRPFVKVNCAASHQDMLDAGLFGVEGHANDDVPASKGELEAANGGTLFLEDVSDLSLFLQEKLLKLLQEKTFRRIGGNEDISIDVRIIAATTQSIEGLVAQHRFREDLRLQLSVVELVLPALRERPEDIPVLVRYFMRRSSQEFDRDVVDASPEVMARFMTYPWPGNVSELEHIVERSVLLARGSTVQVDDLPPSLQVQPPVSPSPQT